MEDEESDDKLPTWWRGIRCLIGAIEWEYCVQHVYLRGLQTAKGKLIRAGVVQVYLDNYRWGVYE